MYVLCWFLLVLAAKTAAFQQEDYNLTSERMGILDYDKNWIIAKSANFKYNRTVVAHNITFDLLKDLGNDVKFQVQAYRFASNEYRLFPMTFTIDLCKVLTNNEFGLQNFYRCGNYTGCPMLQGKILICNWIPDGAKFPPHCPSGSYRMDLTLVHASKEIANAQWYMMVEKRISFG